MAAAKKGLDLALILGGGGKGGKSRPAPAEDMGDEIAAEEPADDGGITPAFRTAAEEYLDAVESGDRETAIRTLKAAIVECVETHTEGLY